MKRVPADDVRRFVNKNYIESARKVGLQQFTVRSGNVHIRLVGALREGRHLRNPRVLCQRDGSPVTQKIVQDYVRRAARRANVKPGVHRLRHTFCSHLAMCGAPARAIQDLAVHMDLATTQRYMHLSPAAIEGAIRLLDQYTSLETCWRRETARTASPCRSTR
jgi:site-specific recombinase XerD